MKRSRQTCWLLFKPVCAVLLLALVAPALAEIPDLSANEQVAQAVAKPQPAEGATPAARSTEKPVRAVILELHDPITPLSGALLKRRFQQALDQGAEIVVLDIDSPGGYVSTTLELVEMLENATGVRTVALIEDEAISGAALLSLAADEIVMMPQAILGDAGMIMLGEDATFRYVPEKERSYLAQRVRAIAERTKRPASLAEAMLDKDMLVYRVTHKNDGTVHYLNEREWAALQDQDQWERGPAVPETGGNRFFTVSGVRAVELGVANRTIEGRDQLASVINAAEPIPVLRGTWVDTLILILNQPLLTGLLLVVGFVALIIEFGMPGVGVGGLISIFCFGLFFWSRFLGGTSGWFEVSLFAIGLVFLLLELLVIPGFGVAGISGIGLMLFALVMASQRMVLPESSRDLQSLMVDVFTVLGAFVGILILVPVLTAYLGELPIISRLALTPPAIDESTPVPSLAASTAAVLFDAQTLEIGQEGRTSGPLRPSGRVRFGEHLVDVSTEGDFVDHDVPVKVVAKQGFRIIVRQV